MSGFSVSLEQSQVTADWCLWPPDAGHSGLSHNLEEVCALKTLLEYDKPQQLHLQITVGDCPNIRCIICCAYITMFSALLTQHESYIVLFNASFHSAGLIIELWFFWKNWNVIRLPWGRLCNSNCFQITILSTTFLQNLAIRLSTQ